MPVTDSESRLGAGAWSLVLVTGIVGSTIIAYVLGLVSAGEDEGLENASCVLLAISLGTFILAARKLSRWPHRIFIASLAMLMISFLIRELDIERYALPSWIVAIGSGQTKRVWQIAVWISFMVAMAIQWRETWWAFHWWLVTCRGFEVLCAAVLLVASWLMDSAVLPQGPHAPLGEELVELAAYSLILICAFRTHRQATAERTFQEVPLQTAPRS